MISKEKTGPKATDGRKYRKAVIDFSKRLL